MQQREMKGWWGRYALFLVFSFGILGLHLYLSPPRKPRKPQPGQQQAAQPGMDQKLPSAEGVVGTGAEHAQDEPKPEVSEEPTEAETAPEQPGPTEPEGPAEQTEVDVSLRVVPDPSLVTLGSLDPASPFREMVTLTNLGAAVVRIELNSPRFDDLEDRSGYLGHPTLDEILNENNQLAPDETARRVKLLGCRVDVVGPGTPAARAGLEPGDLITAVDGREVSGFRTLRQALENAQIPLSKALV